MRKLVLCFAILIAAYSAAYGGIFKDSVEFEDLSQLSAEGLQALKETEFEVFLANVKVAAAKVAQERAKDPLKEAERLLEKEQLDLKAAKAEHEAAEAKQEKERLAKAEKNVQSAKEAVKKAELFVRWKNKEVKVKKAELDKAKLELELAEAKRDLARVSRLVGEKVPSASKYSLKDYENKINKIQEKIEKALDKQKSEIQDAQQLKAQYEKATEQKTI
ncbi:MAG: hypothetical protein PVG99_01080 [Desulfobacteraceae bacterium]|jgi:hypothetical protein